MWLFLAVKLCFSGGLIGLFFFYVFCVCAGWWFVSVVLGGVVISDVQFFGGFLFCGCFLFFFLSCRFFFVCVVLFRLFFV